MESGSEGVASASAAPVMVMDSISAAIAVIF